MGSTTRFFWGDGANEFYKYMNYLAKETPKQFGQVDQEHGDGFAFTSPAGSSRCRHRPLRAVKCHVRA